jgi:hypothetical protein
MRETIVGVLSLASGFLIGTHYRPPVPRVVVGLPAAVGYSVRASAQEHGGDWFALEEHPGEPFEAGATFHEVPVPYGARVVLVEVHVPTGERLALPEPAPFAGGDAHAL